MAVEDIEKRVRAMTGKKDIPDDKQQAAFQEAQNELVRINSERQNNLALANAEANADAQVNETLLQAGEMAAMSSPGVQQQIETMNPQTQAVLGKYGLGKPRVQRTQGREVKVTPQKVQITNNNITNTTNNVAVPPANIGGPVQGRTLAVKQEDPGQARFKTWIQNAFAKQNAKAAQREKEYQRREWSLSRSANKMMKHLSDLGSTISEKLNPNRMASTIGGQFKTMLFLFGTMFLAKHWKRVIDIGARIEEFFVGAKGEAADGKGRGRPGFAKMLIGLFGGDPNDSKASIGQTIKDFFYTGDKNRAGVFDLILEKINHFFEIRGEAVKAIQPPKLDLKDINGTLTSMLGYIGDILKTLIGGPGAAKTAIQKEINKVAAGESLNNDIGAKGRSSTSNSLYHGKASSGAQSLFSIDSRGKDVSRNFLEASDLTASGELKDKAEASIAQARDIDRFINAAKETGSISVTPVIQGLQRLKNKASSNDSGKVPVDNNWVDNKLSPKKKEELVHSGDISQKSYKFVIRPKTEEEYKNQDAATSFAIEYGKDYLLGDKSLSKVGGGIITSTNSGSTGAKVLKTISDINSAPLRWVGDRLGISEATDAIADAKKAAVSQLARWLEKDKIIDLVPADQLKELPEGWEIYNNPYFTDEITLTEISPRVLDEITKHFLGDQNATLDSSSPQQVEQFKAKLENFARINGQEVNYSGDYNQISEKLKKIKDLEKKEKQFKQEEEQHYDTSNLKNSVDYVSNGAKNIYNGFKEYFSTDKKKKYPPLAKTEKEFVDLMRPLYSKELEKKGFDTKYTDILVAQSAMESNWGKSQSGKFNLSGIKADKDDISKGLYTECSTTEYENGIKKEGVVEKFRDFKSLDDFVDYKVRFLDRDRYKAFDGDSINDFINRVVNGGYATEPKYGEILASWYSRIQDNYPDSNQILPDDTQRSPTSPDASGVYTAQNITEPTNYVEKIPSSTSYTAQVDWSSSNSGWGGGEAVAMATKNATSTVTPTSVTPINTSSSGSSTTYNTPSANTAKELVANNDMTEIAKGISGKISTLNENIIALQKIQVATTGDLSRAIGNIQVNINAGGGGQSKSPVQSATGNPYQTKWG